MKNKKILITGGAGFIGSNLSQRLSENNDIIIYDNFFTGNHDNIKDLIRIGNVELIEASILDGNRLLESIKDVDYVFHMAAVTSVPLSIERPAYTNDVNVKGYINLLDAALKNDVKKVILASSAAIYGNFNQLPLKEEYRPYIHSPYALTKLVSEYYNDLYLDLYGLQTISLRYFNVYGPKQDPSSHYASVIPIFARKAMANDDLTIHGDGEQTRDFIYVDDIVEANIIAAESSCNGVYNIATGKETSINKLADLLKGFANSKSRIVHSEEREGDVKYSYADVSKAKDELGFEAKYGIDKGLKLTYQWYKDNF